MKKVQNLRLEYFECYSIFHTVRIVLYIGLSVTVVGSLTEIYLSYLDTQLLGQNTQYTELCVQYEKLE